MVAKVKYVAFLLLAAAMVYLFGLASREIEREIGNFPFLELVQGKEGDFGILKPLAGNFLLFLAILLTILVLTETVVLTPSWAGWIYSFLVSTILFFCLRDKVGAIFGGFLLVATIWHVGAAKNEIHLRIKFNPSLLGRGRSIVALVLLLVLLVPCYKGTKQLLETKGKIIQKVAEEKVAEWIDQQLPEVLDQALRSDQVTPLLQKLPPGVSLEDLQKEMLNHFPKGTVFVAKVKEQIPKIVSLLRDQARLTLKGGLQGLFLLVMLASLVLWPISILLILAKALSALAGLLTKPIFSLLIHTGVIREVTETVELKRLTF